MRVCRATTPAAAIQWGTIANQKTVSSTLAALADEVERAKLGAPAIVVVGQCADLREHLKWAERMPLFGRRIVVTRATDKVSSFARELRALGAEVIEFPDDRDGRARFVRDARYADRAPRASSIGSFSPARPASRPSSNDCARWARTFARWARRASRRSVPRLPSALKDFALIVDAMPSEYRAEAILDAIGIDKIRGARILIPRAQVAREVLPQMLHEHGAAEVVVAPAYKTIAPSGAALDRMREALAAGGYDLVAFHQFQHRDRTLSRLPASQIRARKPPRSVRSPRQPPRNSASR